MENNNNDRNMLLHRIQVCDFVLHETALFLDSHPNHKEALEYFRKHAAMAQAAKMEYTPKIRSYHLYGRCPRGPLDLGRSTLAMGKYK